MTAAQILRLLAVALSGGVIVSIVGAISTRRKIGADATAVITAAARELVDPLRQELANERAANAEVIAMERRKVAQLREELEQAMVEARALRNELHLARAEADQLRAEAAESQRRIRELEEGNPV